MSPTITGKAWRERERDRPIRVKQPSVRSLHQGFPLQSVLTPSWSSHLGGAQLLRAHVCGSEVVVGFSQGAERDCVIHLRGEEERKNRAEGLIKHSPPPPVSGNRFG